MKNYIEHETFVDFYNKDEEIFNRLFNDVSTWNEFNKRLKKECKDYTKFSYAEKEGSEKMIGDLFEIFGELFFKILSPDTRIGLYDYHPVKSIEDYGVDGTCKNLEKENVAVQIKYRGNPTKELVTEDLRNVQGQAYRKYKVPVEGKNIVIFTNCKGVHYVTKRDVFCDSLIVYGSKSLSDRVDNNTSFWELCKCFINNTIEKRYGKTK